MSHVSLQRMAGCDRCSHKGMGSATEPEKIYCKIEKALIKPKEPGHCPYLTIVGFSMSKEDIQRLREAQAKKR